MAKVIHLVSDVNEHPENTAADFKVSFNTPFSLKGKRIALIDATLTKSNFNIWNDGIGFIYMQRRQVLDVVDEPFIVSKRPWTRSITTPEAFFQRFTQEFKARRGGTPKLLGKCEHTLSRNGRFLRIKFFNETDYEAIINIDSTKWNVNDPYGRTGDDNGRLVISVDPHSSETVSLRLRRMDWSFLNDLEEYNTFTQKSMIFFLKHKTMVEKPPKLPDKFRTGPGYFENIEDFISAFNDVKGFSKVAQLSLKHGKVVLTTRANLEPCEIQFQSGLEKVLGFDGDSLSIMQSGKEVEFRANRPPNLYRGPHHFFVFCSLVKNVMVNNVHKPLLSTLDATKGKYGEQIMHPVIHPLYVETDEGPHQLIEIVIEDDSGNRRNILMGKTKLTLSIIDK